MHTIVSKTANKVDAHISLEYCLRKSMHALVMITA